MNLIIALLGLGWTAVGYTFNQARRIHARLSGLFLAAVMLVIFEVILNLAGAQIVNLIILLVCNIVLLIALSRPEVIGIFLGTHIAGYAAVGAANPNVDVVQGAVRGVRTGWNQYIHVVIEILLWFSVISLFLGTISLWGRFWSALVIISAIIVMYYVTVQLREPRIFYKVAKSYACIVLIIGIMYAISPATYVKFMGFDFLDFARISDFESAVERAEKTDREREEKINADKVETLIKRIKEVGISGLNKVEKEQWHSLRGKRDKETIPAKISDATMAMSGELSGKSEPAKSTKDTLIKKISDNEWEIVYNPSDNGWVAEINIEKGGRFQVVASGEYERAFSGNGKIHWEKYYPDGRRRPAMKLACYAGKLLSENIDFGFLLARISRSEIIQVGMGKEFFITDSSKIEFGINTNDNDQWNRGGPLNIKVKRIG